MTERSKGMEKQSLREIMSEMTTKEIVMDFLHIAWYIAWRWTAIVAVFFALMLLMNWEWWR